MVDETTREMESGMERMTNAVTHALNIMSTKETNPMKQKLMAEVARLPSSERMAITFHPGLEKAVERFCMQNRIPFALFREGQERNLGQSGVWIPKIYQQKILGFITDLERNNPHYFRDNNAGNFLWNLGQCGDKDVLRQTFNSREEALRFRNKLFQGGDGAACAMTRDPESPDSDTWIVYVAKDDIINSEARMDWMQSTIEDAVTSASGLGSLLKEAQIKWDEKEEHTFLDEVLQTVERGVAQSPVYLVDTTDPERYLYLDPRRGIRLKDGKDAREKGIVSLKDLRDMLKEDRETAIDSIQQAVGKSFDSIHNMKVMSKEEFRNQTKQTYDDLTELREALSTLKQNHKADDLLALLKHRPNLSSDAYLREWNGTEQELFQALRSTRYARDLIPFVFGKTVRETITEAAQNYFTQHRARSGDLSVEERIAVIREVLNSPEVKQAVFNHAICREIFEFCPEFSKKIWDDLSESLDHAESADLKEAEKEAERGDKLWEKERARAREEERKTKEERTGTRSETRSEERGDWIEKA